MRYIPHNKEIKTFAQIKMEKLRSMNPILENCRKSHKSKIENVNDENLEQAKQIMIERYKLVYGKK